MNSDMVKRDETLAACMLLAMYKTQACPEDSKQAYICHLQGCGRLIQFRCAQAHASGLAHQLHRMFRAHGVSWKDRSCRVNSGALSANNWHIPWKLSIHPTLVLYLSLTGSKSPGQNSESPVSTKFWICLHLLW